MSRPRGDRGSGVLAALATVLTLWSMTPVMDGRGWWGPSLLVVALVLAVGTGLRRLRAPLALIAPVQVVAGVLGLTAWFAGDQAVLWVLPGPDAVATVTRLIADGGDTIRRYQSPVPVGDGIWLLVAAGVLAVAVLVDLIAVTLRAPAAAGLPLLALYCVPSAVVLDGLSWRYFVAAALGWLLLLAHDASARVLRWGRLLPRWGSASGGSTLAADTGALSATGRRLGVAAIAAAVLLPALAPGLAEAQLTRGGQAGGDDRLGGISVINPVLTLRDNLSPRSDVEVLRYTTTQTALAPLRILTADNFDGTTWKPSVTNVPRRQRVSRGLPDPPGLANDVARQGQTMRIQVGPTLDQDFLPLPYPSRSVDIKGVWLYDATSLNVLGDGETVRNKDYSVEYLAVSPTVQQLRASTEPPDAIRTTYTRLPRSLPDVVRKRAAEVTRGASTKYDQAMALQQWFRESGGFTYSTQAPSDAGGDAVAAFLVQKRGFCVQFSSAMAVMARSLGIPARIAVGFLPGTRVGDGVYSTRLTDAHAWPELYFEGAGWVRFEPTPATRAGSAPLWAQPVAAPLPSSGPSAGAPATSSVGPSVARPRVAPGDAAATPGSSSRAADPALDREVNVPWRVVGVVLLLLAVLGLSPTTAALARRRRRRAAHDDRARIEAAWADLHEGVGDLGVALMPGGTPRQQEAELALAAGLSTASPNGQALARVAQVVERSRYARGQVVAADVETDVRSVLRALASTRSRRQRVLAMVLPRSGTSRLTQVGDRAGRRAGGVDRRLARRLHLLSGRRPWSYLTRRH